MAKFNPKKALVDLGWEDMPGLEDGVVPEPSKDRVREWQRGLHAARAALNIEIPEGTTFAGVAKIMLDQDTETLDDRIIDAYALLCGANPPSNAKGQPKKRPEPPEPPIEPRRPGLAADQVEIDEHDQLRAEYERLHTEFERARAKYESDIETWNASWTSGHPTRQQLDTLPYRYQQGFFEYLTDAFQSPRRGTADTSS